jgi:hypothetical protein
VQQRGRALCEVVDSKAILDGSERRSAVKVCLEKAHAIIVGGCISAPGLVASFGMNDTRFEAPEDLPEAAMEAARDLLLFAEQYIGRAWSPKLLHDQRVSPCLAVYHVAQVARNAHTLAHMASHSNGNCGHLFVRKLGRGYRRKLIFLLSFVFRSHFGYRLQLRQNCASTPTFLVSSAYLMHCLYAKSMSDLQCKRGMCPHAPMRVHILHNALLHLSRFALQIQQMIFSGKGIRSEADLVVRIILRDGWRRGMWSGVSSLRCASLVRAVFLSRTQYMYVILCWHSHTIFAHAPCSLSRGF